MMFTTVTCLLEPFPLIVLVLIILASWVTILHYRAPCKNFPPGPWGPPIVGILPYMSKHIYKSLYELSKKHGDVYSVKLGSNLRVIVNGIDAIRECLVEKGSDFADRPSTGAFTMTNPHAHGIANGRFNEIFKRRRRFAHTTLKGFGFGKISMESKITEEVSALLDEFRQLQGQPFDTGTIISRSVSNIICSITFGKRYEYTDPEFVYMVDTMGKLFQITTQMFKLISMPFLMPFKKKFINQYLGIGEDLIGFCKRHIEQHRATLDESNIRDFIDAYLVEAKNQGSDGEFNDDDLQYTLLDLFAAGTETTATTLKWALLLMVVYPEIQQKVFEEIEQNVGINGLPKLEDRERLPYTEATLLEIQRISSIAPFTLNHCALTDSTLCGYNIPKGTIVILVLWSLHHDPKVWPDPGKFDPNRFYDEQTRTVKKHASFLPFSAGRRVCLGEQLAKHEMFLYFSAMIQQLRFMLPGGADTPSTEGVHGFTHNPEPFELVIETRGV